MTKPVSIHPSSFSDNLADLPIEDVVARIKNEERVRRDNLDDMSQRSVPIRFRSRPASLEMCIDELRESLEVGGQVLTRCMCRQAEAWFRSLTQISVLTSVYRAVRRDSDGHIDIEEQLKRNNSFNFITTVPVGGSGMTSYSGVAWVRDYLSDLSAPLGTPTYRLFLLGLCWSVSTNVSSVRGHAIQRYLRPEVDRFLQYLHERMLLLAYFGDVLRNRQE